MQKGLGLAGRRKKRTVQDERVEHQEGEKREGGEMLYSGFEEIPEKKTLTI